MTNKPSLKRINERLSVDVETGRVVTLHSHARAKAGDEAGTIHPTGYRVISIDGESIYAHRLVFFVAHGYWPSLIDHINGDKLDNRLANLRDASAHTNAINRSKYVGARLPGVNAAPNGRWTGRVAFDGVIYSLGTYGTEEEAHSAYLSTKAQVASAEKIARIDAMARIKDQIKHKKLQARNAA